MALIPVHLGILKYDCVALANPFRNTQNTQSVRQFPHLFTVILYPPSYLFEAMEL